MSEENLTVLAEAEADVLLSYFGHGGETGLNDNERERILKLERDLKRLESILQVTGKRFDSVDECPEWAKETVRKLTKDGHLRGDGVKLSLSEDMLRILVILDRITSV
jgi:hypothetical protein